MCKQIIAKNGFMVTQDYAAGTLLVTGEHRDHTDLLFKCMCQNARVIPYSRDNCRFTPQSALV